tara:strand:- start:4 stop:1083 length:1080 start_codon:yes stop_codon:yes gene_type:complete
MEKISIVITTRNEEKFIKGCIESVIAFDTKNLFTVEILIIDGMSTDNTCAIIAGLQHNNIVIIQNTMLTQAHGFNLGVKSAKGEWVAWLGAHSIYPTNYLLDLYKSAKKSNSDYTGGIIETVPFDSTYSASIVQAITTHKFGVGNSGFRTGREEGTADTASYGLFRKNIFSKIGLLDERLIRAQDFEFNSRIRKAGGKIWLNPNLIVKYTNQPNLTQFLKKQFFKEAPYNTYMWYLAPYSFVYRHAITGVFTAGIIGGILLSPFFVFIKYTYFSVIVLYFAIAFLSAIQQVKKYKKLLHLFTLPISFFLYHFLHGLGVLGGLLRLATGTSPVQKIKEPWDGYGSFRIKIDEIIKHTVGY